MIVLQLLVGTGIAGAQTYVTGGIYNNTTWTAANSPYVVTGNTVVFQNYTLTVNPGVTVQFNPGTSLEVRGNLLAQGALADSVHFTSTSGNPGLSQWDWIRIRTDLGATAHFKFATVRNSNKGVEVWCCSDASNVSFSRSAFQFNSTGILASSTWYEGKLDSCYFSNNRLAAAVTYKSVTNSLFVGNEIGLEGQNLHVYNNTFTHNGRAVYAEGVHFKNNILKYNSVGYYCPNNGFVEFSCNEITLNDTGVVVSFQDDPYPGAFENNKICNNNTYNLITTSNGPLTIPNNCWCSNDSAAIAAGILDGYDDISRGLITFQPAISCNEHYPVSQCEIFTSVDQLSNKPNMFSLYPNPVYDLTVLSAEKEISNGSFLIMNLLGETVRQTTNIEGKEFSISRDDLPSGI